MDRTGKRLGNVGQPAQMTGPALSPDGKKVLFSIFSPAGDSSDLWLLDVERGVPTRSTFRREYRRTDLVTGRKHDRFSVRQPHDLPQTGQRGAGKEELLWPGH